MGIQTSKLEIAAHLSEVKKLISKGKYDFVPRRKNLQSLAHLGLTLLDAKNIILGLTVNDYYKGPKADFDSIRSGYIWEFKKDIEGIKFYIKIKITEENGEKILKCLGFHEDEFE